MSIRAGLSGGDPTPEGGGEYVFPPKCSACGSSDCNNGCSTTSMRDSYDAVMSRDRDDRPTNGSDRGRRERSERRYGRAPKHGSQW